MLSIVIPAKAGMTEMNAGIIPMTTPTLYHNPRCSKSRQTLALLEENGIQPKVVLYLEQPPTVSELGNIVKKLGFTSARQLMRTKEEAYKASGANDPALSEDALLQRMVENPKLIERPILLANGKAALGRPPENVLEIL